MRNEVDVHPMSPREEGDHKLHRNDRRGDGGAGLPPFAQHAHAVRKFKRVPLKKVAPGELAETWPAFSARYGASGSNACAWASVRAYRIHPQDATKTCFPHCSRCSSPRPTSKSKKAGP